MKQNDFSSILRSGFLTYANSGVDIETADAFVNHLKTKTLENGLANGAPGLGGFAGLLKIQGANLAACTDGVGTKLFVSSSGLCKLFRQNRIAILFRWLKRCKSYQR